MAPQQVAEKLFFIVSEATARGAGPVDEARCIWSLLLTLWPVVRPAEPCDTALQAGRITTILFMVRLCSLAEPTGSAHLSPAYVAIVSAGRRVSQQPAGQR